jgi:TRAP-type C4-dicarboxylate transport system permease small subunit
VTTILGRARALLEQALAAFCVFQIVALTVLVVVAVLFRELGSAFSWYDEVATIMLAWITYYGSAYAALKRGHLASPEILMMLPLRWRLPLFVFGEVLVIGFFLVLAWVGMEVVLLLEGDRLVSLRWVSVQVTQSVIPIGAMLFVLCQLLSVGEEWRNLGRNDRAALVRENI